MSISAEIKKIDSELKKLEQKKSNIESAMRRLEFKKRSLIGNKIESVYTIHCLPTKNGIKEHYVGVYSTYKKARSYIPENGLSFDKKTGCRWVYTIVEKECFTVNMNDLDKDPPSSFPYFGK